jgi:glycosyltransferase involved in cell wall biosynthesis
MTILFFTRLFYPHIGGVEKHIMKVGKRLVKKGYRVIVITENHGYKSHDVINGINIYRIDIGKNEWRKKFIIWRWLWQHKNLIEKADLIHCHDVFFWYLPFAFMYITKPVFTTFHGYESYPITLKAKIQHKIAEVFSNGNMCIGEFIPKWYGTKANIISYGAADFNSRLKNNGKKYDAAFVGRLDEQTGIQTYTKTVAIIREKYPNFSFLIVGDGDYKKTAEKSGKVVGFKSNPEKYLQQGEFAFVSRYLSIIEAMQMKKLVFATYDNQIKKDYLLMSPFAKYIVIENSPEHLATKIIYYKTHTKTAKEIIEKAYSWAKNQSWEKLVDDYLRLWNIHG